MKSNVSVWSVLIPGPPKAEFRDLHNSMSETFCMVSFPPSFFLIFLFASVILVVLMIGKYILVSLVLVKDIELFGLRNFHYLTSSLSTPRDSPIVWLILVDAD